MKSFLRNLLTVLRRTRLAPAPSLIQRPDYAAARRLVLIAQGRVTVVPRGEPPAPSVRGLSSRSAPTAPATRAA